MNYAMIDFIAHTASNYPDESMAGVFEIMEESGLEYYKTSFPKLADTEIQTHYEKMLVAINTFEGEYYWQRHQVYYEIDKLRDTVTNITNLWVDDIKHDHVLVLANVRTKLDALNHSFIK